MAKQRDFDDFLSNIEPSKSTVEYISSVQNNLREYLKKHGGYSCVYIDSFLSGSYSKHTSIRPTVSDKKRDVDIIVVTNYSKNEDSRDVLDELYSILIESKTYEKAEIQHHSIGIELTSISIDVVPVITDDYDDELYWIGDYENGDWAKTDPKGHKHWSTDVNKENEGMYKPLVKIFKWWRRVNCTADVRYPKGITLEKIIADNIGDASKSTEELLIETIENIISNYKEDYVDIGLLPTIDDPSEKVINNNLLGGYEFSDFSAFIDKLVEHSQLLNDEGIGNDTWKKVLGTEFPSDNGTNSNNALVCQMAQHRQKPLWPMKRDAAAFVTLTVKDNYGNVLEYNNNGKPLPKGCNLYFKACTGVKKPFVVKWQITNTGKEAFENNCMRGDFEDSNIGSIGRKEETSFTGSHSVQCFIIKNGICVAKSKDYIINIC